MTADQHLRRWNTGGWLVLAALILVAAGAFVGLLVYDRFLFLVAVGTIGTNAVTWRAGRRRWPLSCGRRGSGWRRCRSLPGWRRCRGNRSRGWGCRRPAAGTRPPRRCGIPSEAPMASPGRKRGTISWTPAVTAPVAGAPRPRAGTLCCSRCRTGDCGMCTRVGCYHPCPEMRSAGVTATSEGAEHGAPGPGRRG